MKTKYCKCNLGGLVIANLETGEGECPICKLPKKLNNRLKTMSKAYNNIRVTESRGKKAGVKQNTL